MATTKAEAIFDRVNSLMEQGISRSEAFDRIAQEENRPKDSIRGAFYGHKRKLEGGTPTRTRRRETTPETAVEDARATLERAINAIDAEIAAAEERAREAASEAKALKESAKERKEAIQARLEALR